MVRIRSSHFDADPEPVFPFGVDQEVSSKWCESSTTSLQTHQGSVLNLCASIVCGTAANELWILDADLDPDPAFDFDADPHPAFHSKADPDSDPVFRNNADPDPAFKNNSDPDPQHLNKRFNFPIRYDNRRNYKCKDFSIK
jgi:hypothetical protein